jgi:hypothetical protein
MIRTPRWFRASLMLLATAVLAQAPIASGAEPWRRLASTPPYPPSLYSPAGAYDPVRQRVIAIEMGYTTKATPVVEFDLAPEPHWSYMAVSGTAPNEHYRASVVYDPVRDRMLIVGSDHEAPIEVWAVTLSGAPAWQKLATVGNPVSRYGQSVVYDPVHDQLLMFGGVGQTPTWHEIWLPETWTLPLQTLTWTQVGDPARSPAGREGQGAIYDPVQQRMLVFGGYYQDSTTHYCNDVWQWSPGDTTGWVEIDAVGPRPGARLKFGTTYDPARRRMLVHGGEYAYQAIQPDDLWALSLDGAPEWTQVVAGDTLRGRSYSLDVYDPVGDRLVTCGGAGFSQVQALPLASPTHWQAVLPSCCPLPAPSSRNKHAVVHDSRRDRFLVVGGSYSDGDSATWIFQPEGDPRWRAVRERHVPYPGVWYFAEHARQTVYDSLADRVIFFDGAQAWSLPADLTGPWTQLGPSLPIREWPGGGGSASGLALDTRRNRLIVTGGFEEYPHSWGYSLSSVWALPLQPDSTWRRLGDLPESSFGHSAYYDGASDRLMVVGGRHIYDTWNTDHYLGAVVWSTTADSVRQWSELSVAGDELLPGPPLSRTAFDTRTGRLFMAADSRLWVRQVDGPGPWTPLQASPPAPNITSEIVFDPVRDQLLALYANLPGETTVDVWAIAVGPMSVTVLSVDRAADAITLQLRSVTAFGHSATLERREEGASWQGLGQVAFGPDGEAAFTDRGIRAGHDYHYRVAVVVDTTTWYSAEIFAPDPGSLRFALLGAHPNPAVGAVQVAFSLPGSGAARLEVFDVNGRRRASREVGAMGPGMHAVSFERSSTWEAGVYFARLQRGRQSQSMKLVFTR